MNVDLIGLNVLYALIIAGGAVGYFMLFVVLCDSYTPEASDGQPRRLPWTVCIGSLFSVLFLAAICVGMFGWVGGFLPACAWLLYELLGANVLCTPTLLDLKLTASS